MCHEMNAPVEPLPICPAQRAWLRGDYRACVERMLKDHGPEIRAYIRGVSQPKLADDIYGQAVLDLWTDLRSFEWRCSARTYLFTLARNAVARVHKLEMRARRRDRVYAETRWLGELLIDTRTPTAPYLRSEVKMRFRALRKRLTEDEQSLLVLRIDRRLSFNELATIMASQGAAMSTRERARASGRLRKRFQTVKNKLRRMMIDEGLLEAS